MDTIYSILSYSNWNTRKFYQKYWGDTYRIKFRNWVQIAKCNMLCFTKEVCKEDAESYGMLDDLDSWLIDQ